MFHIKIGDKITFRPLTRWGAPLLTRLVNGFDSLGRPTVRYNGWSDFIVKWDEIIKVQS